MQDLKKLSLLIVDDEEDIRELLETYLEPTFKTVKSAKNGLEAFELCNKEKFDLVITDIMMPGLNADGATLARKLRHSCAEIRVIIGITGRSNETEEELLRAGINAILYKPFELETLLETLEQYSSKITS